MKPKKARADEMVVAHDLAASTDEARALIMRGVVIANVERREWRIQTAGERVPAQATLRIKGKARKYVSRGGDKLEGALEAFELDPTDRICADIGVSTGGFTDCLLRRGAERVHAVDVGYGDVAWSVRQDPKVILYERTNARLLTRDHFGERVALVVIDVSFISLEAVLPAVVEQLAPGADLVCLVKPQFEAPPEAVPGGVVVDEEVRRAAVDRVIRAASMLGLSVMGEVPSPILGRQGNVELLLHLKAAG